MNAKNSVFVICVETIIYLLLHNLHDCTFNGTRSCAKFKGSIPSSCRIMAIYVFFRLSQFLQFFFSFFFLFVYLTVGVFSKGYCLIYRQGQGMKLQRQVLYQVNILYQINFRSCHDSRRLKIMAQNHTNFCHAKIIGYSKGSKKI